MIYTVKQLGQMAGVSVRTLHSYDQLGLLQPERHNHSGYRLYGEAAAVRLQQILFFRELDFSLSEIHKIMAQPGYNALEALESQRYLLVRRAERINTIIKTVDRTIEQIKGETNMEIKEYYEGLSDEKIESYRKEVKQRWGEKTLADSEARISAMGKTKFTALQAEGGAIFKAVCDNMPKGAQSQEVQMLIARWRVWLEDFSHYSDEAVLGLGRAYSQHAEFAAFFKKYHADLPDFLTQAIEYYCAQKSHAK